MTDVVLSASAGAGGPLLDSGDAAFLVFLASQVRDGSLGALRAVTPVPGHGARLAAVNLLAASGVPEEFMRVARVRWREVVVLRDLADRVRVVNLHGVRVSGADAFSCLRVDRSTPLGNPFPVLGVGRWSERTEAAIRLAFPLGSAVFDEARRAGGFGRGATLDAYRTWLRVCLREGGPVRVAVEDLVSRVASGERLALGCFCAPRPCHAEVVREVVLGLVRERLSAPE